MLAAGLEFASSVMTKKSWAENFIQQWEYIEAAAKEIGCLERLHIWVDSELSGYVDESKLASWLYRPTVEKWDKARVEKTNEKYSQLSDKEQTPIVAH